MAAVGDVSVPLTTVLRPAAGSGLALR